MSNAFEFVAVAKFMFMIQIDPFPLFIFNLRLIFRSIFCDLVLIKVFDIFLFISPKYEMDSKDCRLLIQTDVKINLNCLAIYESVARIIRQACEQIDSNKKSREYA